MDDAQQEETNRGENVGPIVEGTQLSYIEQGCPRIPEEFGQWYGQTITRLDLSFNCLVSLEGLELFTELQELVLDSNNLDDSVTFPKMPHLHTLFLNKNRISDVDLLIKKIKSCLPALSYLSLLGNIACPNQLSDSQKDEEDYQRYRYYVIHKLPNLRFLDSSPISATEQREAGRRGSYMRVAKPEENVDKADEATPGRPSLYSPLPRVTNEGNHQGSFGKCRYVYYGRHSEGNRFIRNNDL